MRSDSRDRDADAKAMCERSELLERFELFDRGRLQSLELPQERHAIGVDAEMSIRWEPRGNRAYTAAECVAGVRNRRAAEVQGIAAQIERDFYDVGVDEIRSVIQRMARG